MLNILIAHVEHRGIRNPLFSMLYFVLRQNGAKDWLSGLKLSSKHVGKSHKLQFHHIFPKSLLKKEGLERNEINEIANHGFHRRQSESAHPKQSAVQIFPRGHHKDQRHGGSDFSTGPIGTKAMAYGELSGFLGLSKEGHRHND